MLKKYGILKEFSTKLRCKKEKNKDTSSKLNHNKQYTHGSKTAEATEIGVYTTQQNTTINEL